VPALPAPERGIELSTVTQDYSMVVGGAWVESGSGARMEATSPATGESSAERQRGHRTVAPECARISHEPPCRREAQSVAEKTTRPETRPVVTVTRQQPGAGTFTYDG